MKPSISGVLFNPADSPDPARPRAMHSARAARGSPAAALIVAALAALAAAGTDHLAAAARPPQAAAHGQAASGRFNDWPTAFPAAYRGRRKPPKAAKQQQAATGRLPGCPPIADCPPILCGELPMPPGSP